MMTARIFRAYFLAVVLCGAAISSAQTYLLTGQIKTVAGSGVQGSTGDGGAATAAKLGASLGAAALDSAKNLYIADGGNSVIRKVDTSGSISTVAGTLGTNGYTGDGGAATSATIDGPVGIVFDTAGNMYFSESNNHVIRKVDTSGKILTFKSLGFAPVGIAINSTNTIFIADPSNNKIWKLDSSQNLGVFAGTGTAGYTGDAGAATSATLSGPVAVATVPTATSSSPTRATMPFAKFLPVSSSPRLPGTAPPVIAAMAAPRPAPHSIIPAALLPIR